MEKVLERKDVPKEQTWNSESVYGSWEEWQAEFDSVTADLKNFSTHVGEIGKGPSFLADWLELLTIQRRRVLRLVRFTRVATAVDVNDTTANGKMSQVMGLYGKFSAATAFGPPEMLAVGDTLLEWTEQEPRLAVYHHYFEDLLRQATHRRSSEVEEVLGMLSDPFSNVRRTASELTSNDLTFGNAVDSQGEEHPVRQDMIPPLGIKSVDRDLRRTAWESYCDSLLSMKNTLASNYITSVKQAVFTAKARGYESVLESILSPRNVPVEIFDVLINAFKKNLPTWHRYWDVKRKVLGYSSIHPYDIWAPIVQKGPVIQYEQAVELIGEAVSPLGEEYVATLRKGCLEDRWVDYAPNAGKMQGAASGPCYDTFPFAFMSYDNTLMSLSVLAHELGHSMHTLLTDNNQPPIYNFDLGDPPSMAIMETPSNVHQALTRAYLLRKKADDTEFQITLVDEALFNFHRYFFIMPNLARFEGEVYARAENGKPLTADILSGIMGDIYSEGYGSTMTDDPLRSAITWTQFLHLYQPYYTFQYAIGISAAHALADELIAGGNKAVDNYLSFLKAGTSLDAMDLFKLAGVDMSGPMPIDKTFIVLENLVDRLEEVAVTDQNSTSKS